jgi:hypothetical protein
MPLYDPGEAEGQLYYVMPFRGPRVAARPARSGTAHIPVEIVLGGAGLWLGGTYPACRGIYRAVARGRQRAV